MTDLALTDEDFKRWWYTVVSVEDRAAYIHLHQGHEEGARFVCALEMLIAQNGGVRTDDVIVRAYLIAHKLPESELRSTALRSDAITLYEDDVVTSLIEAVRYREIKAAEQRIALRATSKIEELFDRAKPDGEFEYDNKERLAVETLALESTLKLLSIRERVNAKAQDRRDKRAVQRAMAASAQRGNVDEKPPTLEDATASFKMLVKEHGYEQVKALLDAAVQPALTVPAEHESG